MQHASAEALDHNSTAPLASLRKQSGRVLEFRPRASSLAVQAAVAAGLTAAELRLANIYARHVRFATDADARRWHVKRGEIFMQTGRATSTRIAAELGVSVGWLAHLRCALKRAGVVDVRKVRRTQCAIVFKLPARLPSAAFADYAPINTGIKSGINTHREPRTEPRNTKPLPEDPIPLMAYSYRDAEQHRALPSWQCNQCGQTGSDPPPRTCPRCDGPFLMVVDRDRERRTA